MSMGFFGKRSSEVAAPVIPGPSRAPLEDCDGCGYGDANGVIRVRQVVDGVDMVLCLDAIACSERARGGVSPETYAAGLRGELLAVTP